MWDRVNSQEIKGSGIMACYLQPQITTIKCLVVSRGSSRFLQIARWKLGPCHTSLSLLCSSFFATLCCYVDSRRRLEVGGGWLGERAPPGPRCYISRPLSGTGQRGWRAKSRRHRGGGGGRGSNNLRWWEETEEMMATKGKMPRWRRRRSAPPGRTYMWQKCIRKTDGSHCPASRSTTIPTSPLCPSRSLAAPSAS